VNHVPDDVLDAVDDLGRAILTDDPAALDCRLRSDFRVRIDCDRAALDAGTVAVAFRLERGDPEPTLRGHGSFVTTIVDGVDDRLRAWGIEPPATYAVREADGRWQIYAGRADLP
jgi:hypothetical protein